MKHIPYRQNPMVIDLLKKSCLVERDILLTQEPMRIYSAWVFVVIAPYWEERG